MSNNLAFITNTLKSKVSDTFLGEDTSQSNSKAAALTEGERRKLTAQTGIVIRNDDDLAKAHEALNSDMRAKGIRSSRTAEGILRGETDEGSVYGPEVFKREGWEDPEDERYKDTYRTMEDKAKAIDGYYNDARQMCSNVGYPNTGYLRNKDAFDSLLQRIIDGNESDLLRLMSQCEQMFDGSSEQVMLRSLNKVAGLGRTKMFQSIVDTTGPGQVSSSMKKVVELAGNAKGTVQDTNAVSGILQRTGHRPSSILSRTIPGIAGTVTDGQTVKTITRNTDQYSDSWLLGGSDQTARTKKLVHLYGR